MLDAQFNTIVRTAASHRPRPATLIAFLIATGNPQDLSAQTIGPLIQEPDDVPGQRIISEYAPPSHTIAGFQASPTLMLNAKADSNVFSRTTVKKADLILQAEPRLRLRQDNRSTSIIVDAVLRANRYITLSDQNATEYNFAGTYVRGSGGPNSISLNVGYRREAIQRGTVENDLVGGEPLMRRVLNGSLTGRKRFNRLAIDAQALLVRQIYEDVSYAAGSDVEQSFRNATRYGIHGVGSYEVAARTAFITSIEYDSFNYNSSPAQEDRDAENWSIAAGFKYEITRAVFAQFAIGYRNYNFRNAALKSIKGIAISGHLRYFPSRLLAFRGFVEQSNTTSPYDLTGAVTLTNIRIDTEYEMRRNLSWTGTTLLTLEDYASKQYRAKRFEVFGGPKLRLNRNLSVSANVGYARRFVSGSPPFEPYSQVYGVVSVTLAR